MSAATAASRRVPERPLLKPWYRLAAGEGRVLLEYGHAVLALEGGAAERFLPALLPLLDGTRTVAELAASLGEEAAPAIDNALRLLADRGLLCEGPRLPDGVPPPLARTAEQLAAAGLAGGSISACAAALRAARVGVAGSGGIATEASRLLLRCGAGRLERLEWEAEPGLLTSLDLALAAPGPAELPVLEAWNRRALAAGTAWLQVLPFDGCLAAIGPLYVPGATCCYACFRGRRARNAGCEEELWSLARRPAAYPASPALEAAVAGLAVELTLRWLVDPGSVAPGVLHALERGDWLRLTAHTVYRAPRCPVCGPAWAAAAPLPWYESEAA